MDRIFQIVKREYLERVRNKWFLIATILGPALMMGMMILPALLITKSTQETKCAVLDQTGFVFEGLKTWVAKDSALSNFTLLSVENHDDPIEHYNQRLTSGEFDSFLFIPADLLETNEASYFARGVGIATERMPRALTAVVTEHRLTAEGLDPDRIDDLTKRVSVDAFQVDKSGQAEKKEFGAVYIMTMILVMMLYVTILSYGGVIMNSTVQEKSNRVMEVLLSKASPFELLIGKLLGNGAAGLTQYLVWAVMGSILLGMGAPMMASADFELNVEPIVFLWFVVFFLLGFFTMAALYAAVGSM